MNIEEYQSFKCLVDTYFKYRKKKLLKEINNIISTRKSIRKQFIKEIENNERYIELFSVEYQIKIGINILNRESHHKFEIFKIVKILLYVSDEALAQILNNVEDKALNDLVYVIKNILRNGDWNEIELFKPMKNKKYSKRGKKKALQRLYKKCEKYNS